MKVGLFIPCYIDAFFPEVGVATLELLKRLGVPGRTHADRPAPCASYGKPVSRN
jgi:Fe-S oxidoreductase